MQKQSISESESSKKTQQNPNSEMFGKVVFEKVVFGKVMKEIFGNHASDKRKA